MALRRLEARDRWAMAVIALGAGILAACSPAEPPPPAQKPMTGYAGQALVNAQAHLMGEASAYGKVTWARQPDVDGAAVLLLAPDATTPTVTVKIRDGRIVELVQKGTLTRPTLAALASAAGAPAGQHGPTAAKIEGLLAQARSTGTTASATIGGATYAAVPAGDQVTATPAP